MLIQIAGLLLTLSCSTIPGHTYCDGYQAGFVSGWCEGHPLGCKADTQRCEGQGNWHEGYDAGRREGLKQHKCGHWPCSAEDGQ